MKCLFHHLKREPKNPNEHLISVHRCHAGKIFYPCVAITNSPVELLSVKYVGCVRIHMHLKFGVTLTEAEPCPPDGVGQLRFD